MSRVTITCPECAWETEAEESLIGRRLKCPKCKESFVAEKAGIYDFVDPPPRPKVVDPPPALASPQQGKPSRKPKAATPPPPADDSSELLANLEKWAEE